MPRPHGRLAGTGRHCHSDRDSGSFGKPAKFLFCCVDVSGGESMIGDERRTNIAMGAERSGRGQRRVARRTGGSSRGRTSTPASSTI
jgi:hypothetical protein